MASESLPGPSATAVAQLAASNSAPSQTRVVEQFQVDESHGDESDENVQYPTGRKLWLTMASLCIACFMSGLVSRARPPKPSPGCHHEADAQTVDL